MSNEEVEKAEKEEEELEVTCFHNCPTQFSPNPCGKLESGLLCINCDDYENIETYQ